VTIKCHRTTRTSPLFRPREMTALLLAIVFATGCAHSVGALRTTGAATVAVTPKLASQHTSAPPNIRPLVKPALRSEGVWKPSGRKLRGWPVSEVTFVRPVPGVSATVVWMDPLLAKFTLFAGTSDPGGSGWKHSGMVPLKLHSALAATFNSGFKVRDSKGGFYAYGKSAAPLRKGAASVVIFKDGTATVGAWGSGILKMSSNIAAVRQTLSLMVSKGRILRTVFLPYLHWGVTIAGHGAAVWRTGIGVTKSGAIVFVGGDGLTPVTLARTLQRAGCVRAMQLDINPEWPALNLYTTAPRTPLRISPHKILPTFSLPTRFIASPDSRDFFAVFVR
jgi:hypothetical protein